MKSRPVNFILCGLGGQGILFMTRVLAQAALRKGINLLVAETHGMAQRGGSVISHLRLGDMKSSLIRLGTAQYLLALEESEAYRNLPYLSKRGNLYANTRTKHFPDKRLKSYLQELGVVSRSLDAGQIAADLGAPMATNLVLLGYFAAFPDTPFTLRELRETIDHISPQQFKAINFKVFDAGFERACK